jgi:hypothetical protein
LVTGPDTEDRQAALSDRGDQLAIKGFASSVHGTNGAMEHVAIVSGIQVGTADEDESLQHVEHIRQVLIIFHRRNHDRDPSGG